MRIQWTESAVHDLTQICEYIEKQGNSAAASRVALSIYQRVSSLTQFPERGRPGPSEYVRELIRQDKERRFDRLQEDLLAAARGAKIKLPLEEVRKKGLAQVLRQRTRRR